MRDIGKGLFKTYKPGMSVGGGETRRTEFLISPPSLGFGSPSPLFFGPINGGSRLLRSIYHPKRRNIPEDSDLEPSQHDSTNLTVFGVNYREKFGLYYVNYSDPARPRIAKHSSHVMAEIIRTRHIPEGKNVQEGDKAPEVHQHHLQ